jgi:Phosphatidylserine/phosphatidylglycerophosphate/cardiolipin synthases and related enzymes
MALLLFTRSDIYQTLVNRKNNGVGDIKAVIDESTATGSQFTNLKTIADVFETPANQEILHHKYCIVDASYPESQPVVITGSHNWSSAAENDNDENTLIIKDAKIANLYMQEFKKRYNDYGGTGTFVVPVAVNDSKIDKFSYSLYQNYPNPFNPATTIKFEIPKDETVKLEIYDMLGRKVKTLFDGNAKQGIVAVDFNAGNLASGIYFYTIKTTDYTATKKLMLMK